MKNKTYMVWTVLFILLTPTVFFSIPYMTQTQLIFACVVLVVLLLVCVNTYGDGKNEQNLTVATKRGIAKEVRDEDRYNRDKAGD